jgi:hypothetical protein
MRKVEVLTEEEKQELEAIKKNYPTYTERDRASGVLLSYRGYSPKGGKTTIILDNAPTHTSNKFQDKIED